MKDRQEFPITVTAIKGEEMKALVPCAFPRRAEGAWVSIRVVGEKQTRLGVLLGDMALGFQYELLEDGTLSVAFAHYNPAIWVPDLNRVVYGCQSWWGVIESPDQLRQITDKDIENVWYVKALRELTEKAKDACPPAPEPTKEELRCMRHGEDAPTRGDR